MTAYATVESLTSKQDAGDYLSASESANYYPMTGNPAGFLTEHQSLAGYLQDTDLTISDGKITEISGVPLSAGDELPSGTMNTSALEYNAVNEISGYNGSAIAQYGAEKQWLVHDDTLVHASNSAQYALGVNLSAVAQLLGVDETVLWTGTIGSQGDTCVLSENLTNFNKLNFIIDEQNGSITQHDCILNVNGASQWPTYIYPIYSRTNGDGAIMNYLWSFSFNAANSGSINKSVIRRDGTTTATNNAKIIKIVGIGRKS